MNDVYIEEDKSILDAIQRLDKSGKKILFVHRDRKLLASLTDGDIRRWILKKGDLNTVRVYKFKISTQLMLLAYSFEEHTLILTFLD